MRTRRAEGVAGRGRQLSCKGVMTMNAETEQKSPKGKIKIYQTSLFQRGLAVFSVVFVAAIYLTVLIVKPNLYLAIGGAVVFLLIVCILYFSTFRAYLLLDGKRGKFLIRGFFGYQNREILLSDLRALTITDHPKYKGQYTLDLNVSGNVVPFNFWWHAPGLQGGYMNSEKQRKRLQKFVMECNAYLQSVRQGKR